MKLVSLLLALLHITHQGFVRSKTNQGSRILEILRGPPQKSPMPPVRTAFLLCQRPGVEKVNRDLLRSAGIYRAALVMSAHQDPKQWPNVLKELLISYPDHLVSFVLDLECPGAMSLLQQVNDTNMFRSPYRWLLLYPPSNETSMSLETCADKAEDILGRLAIFLDSEVLSMCPHKEGGLIIEWYRYRILDHPFMGELGSWQGHSKTKWTERSFKPLAVRRMNLMKHTVNTGYVARYNDTPLHVMDGIETRKDTVAKFFYPVFLTAVEMMNGTFGVKWSDSWGFPVNGTGPEWTGMIGMQLRGDVELSGIPYLMEHVRNTVLSFVAFRAPTRGTFLFRRTPMSYDANLFALPFPGTLWAASAGLISLCILLLYLVLSAEDVMDKDSLPTPSSPVIAAVPIKIHLREKTPKPRQFLATEEDMTDNMVEPFMPPAAVIGDGIQAKARLHGSWSDVMLLVFGAICQQGSPAEARNIPGRIVTMSMLIGIMFLFTSYTASIVVLLQRTSNSIKTLEDLAKSKMPCGAEDYPYNRYLFERVTGEARIQIYKKVISKTKKTTSGNNYMTLDVGMQRLRSEYFAFHALRTSMFPIISDTWQEHEKCALREIDNMIYPQNPYPSTRKFHPIVEIFRITLRKIHECGIREREISRVVPAFPSCTNKGSNFSSVSVMDCHFAMVILTTGILASLVVFGLEHFASHRLRKLRQLSAPQ